jgi:hypothetical protein
MKSEKLTVRPYKPANLKIAIARLLLIFAILLGSQYAHSQEIPVVYKDWLILGESKNHLDVSYRVIQCEGKGKTELKIRSESNLEAVLQCTVTVINLSTNEKVVQEINMPVKSFETLKPDCGAANPYTSLVIDLPATFIPSNITATIIFVSMYVKYWEKINTDIHWLICFKFIF